MLKSGTTPHAEGDGSWALFSTSFGRISSTIQDRYSNKSLSLLCASPNIIRDRSLELF